MRFLIRTPRTMLSRGVTEIALEKQCLTDRFHGFPFPYLIAMQWYKEPEQFTVFKGERWH